MDHRAIDIGVTAWSPLAGGILSGKYAKGAKTKSDTARYSGEDNPPDERKLRIVFDNPGPGNVSEQAYENAVTAAASLSWHFAEANAELSFVAQDYQGGAEVYDFLEYLATVAPQTGSSVLDHLEISGDYNIILTTRPRASIPANLWACSYFIFVGTKN